VAKAVLAGPRLAAKAAAEAPQSKREGVEAAIMRAVQDCLHLLGALKPLLPVLPEAAALEVCDALLALFGLQQQLLSCHAADCLTALAAGAANTGNVAPQKLQSLLKARSPPLAPWSDKPRQRCAAPRLARETRLCVTRLYAPLRL